MAFTLLIPKTDNPDFAMNLPIGEILFVLGPNGVGKSRLMHRFFAAFRDGAQRISAHRQNWFHDSAVSITAAHRNNFANTFRNEDTTERGAWSEYSPEDRIRMAIFDLVAAENNRARKIARAVDTNDLDQAAKFSNEEEPPIKVINELLRLSNLPIAISLINDGELLATKFGSTYGINQLSDGERNALIIIASVLIAPEENLILIDEPERHLHHSISSPLLSLLIKKRPDCAFVVSTHDIMLPLDNKKSNVLLIRSCEFNRGQVHTWDADILPSNTDIDEQTKEDILGSRRKILFIEGTSQSLDAPLYSLVFPNVSVVPKTSCRDVERFVTTIRQEENTHWVRAFGIIDGDGRPQANIDQLKAQGVYALPFYSVEAIYYHPEIQRRVAERQAAVTGGNAVTYVTQAQAAALRAIRPQNVAHLSQRISERAVREELFRNLPNQDTMANRASITININIAAAIQDEEARLNGFLIAADFLSILKRYPIRETGALDTIASGLQFSSRTNYEKAVIKLLMDDEDALNFVKSLFDTLPADIG